MTGASTSPPPVSAAGGPRPPSPRGRSARPGSTSRANAGSAASRASTASTIRGRVVGSTVSTSVPPAARKRRPARRPRRRGRPQGMGEVVGDDHPVEPELTAEQVGDDDGENAARAAASDPGVDGGREHHERPGGGAGQRAERRHLGVVPREDVVDDLRRRVRVARTLPSPGSAEGPRHPSAAMPADLARRGDHLIRRTGVLASVGADGCVAGLGPRDHVDHRRQVQGHPAAVRTTQLGGQARQLVGRQPALLDSRRERCEPRPGQRLHLAALLVGGHPRSWSRGDRRPARGGRRDVGDGAWLRPRRKPRRRPR